MLELDEPGAAAVIAHFLVRIQEDRARGNVKARSEYLAAYPGYGRWIARELDALERHPAPPASTPGEHRFGAYRILRELGRGGQAEVYLAEDSRLGRRVALKVLRGLGQISVERLARFQREAQIASRIEHPHLCTLYESGAEDGVPYLAMRYIEGESLSARISASRAKRASSATPSSTRAEVHAVLELFEKIARAVHAAHEAGILHRDLKPQNVIIGKDGEPVVLDFGLAADLGGEAAELTRSGDVFGTPHYMAPEQVRGSRALTRATDVWALGVSLFETLALRRPFEAPTPETLMQEILRREAPALRRSTSAVPRDLSVVVATALAKEPALRYRTALDLAEDLARVRRGEPIRARPASAFLRLRRWVRREPMRASALLLLLCAMALVGFLAARWSDLVAGAEQTRLAQLEEQLEDGYLRLGEIQMAPAREHFLRALEIDASSTEALAGLGLTYRTPSKAKAGLRELDARAGDVRDAAAIALVRASLLRELGRAEEATALEAKAGTPRTPAALFIASKLALGDHRSAIGNAREPAERALRWMQECVWITPRARALYHFELARIWTIAQPEGSAPFGECLVRLWEHSPSAWYFLGFALPDAEPERKIEAYRHAVALRPRFYSAWSNIGACLVRLKKYDEAEQAYRHALEIRPDFARAIDGLARIAHERKDYSRAIELAEQALALQPEDPAALAQLGRYCLSAGAMERGETHLRAALRIAPDHVEALYRLGLVLFLRGATEEAAEHFRHALRLVPDLEGLEISAAQCLVAVGDYAGATAVYRAILRRNPNYPEALCNLGHNLRRQGQFGEAVEALRRGDELGRARANWKYPSVKWLRHAERIAALERDLLENETATIAAASPEDRATLGEITLARGRAELSARLFAEAFESEPELAERLSATWRTLAARAAALAASAAREPAERDPWQRRAIEWLEQDLAAIHASYESEGLGANNLRQRLSVWRSDPAFDVVREEHALAACAEDLRERCRKHWASVEELLREVVADPKGK